MPARPIRVLILGGTAEARELAEALAGDRRFAVTLSLAGATTLPAATAVETRRGGFGGADGLARFLADAAIDALVDATHPFAATMKRQAAAAAEAAGVPRLAVLRPPWKPAPGERWHEVDDLEAAAAALPAGARALLALGRRHLDAFLGHPATLFVRTVERPADAGPFRFIVEPPRTSIEAEMELFWLHEIDHLVARNSGGAAGRCKLGAARELGLPVILVRRPPPPAPPVVETAAEVLSWLRQGFG